MESGISEICTGYDDRLMLHDLVGLLSPLCLIRARLHSRRPSTSPSQPLFNPLELSELLPMASAYAETRCIRPQSSLEAHAPQRAPARAVAYATASRTGVREPTVPPRGPLEATLPFWHVAPYPSLWQAPPSLESCGGPLIPALRKRR